MALFAKDFESGIFHIIHRSRPQATSTDYERLKKAFSDSEEFILQKDPGYCTVIIHPARSFQQTQQNLKILDFKVLHPYQLLRSLADNFNLI